MTNHFSCASCGETFEKAWSDAEAEAEWKREFAELDPGERALVCDDCHIYA